jgi:hypothetical protein
MDAPQGYEALEADGQIIVLAKTHFRRFRESGN